MDLQSSLPSSTIFHELQTVHDTGFFYSLPSLEDDWAQVSERARACYSRIFTCAFCYIIHISSRNEATQKISWTE